MATLVLNKQKLALLLCWLVISPVLAEQAHRRRYESAYDGLFQDSKTALTHLASMPIISKNDKVMNENMNEVMKLVKANPDKVLVAIGLVASSWLLYQSISLAGDVLEFFEEYQELKGKFDLYYRSKISELEEMYNRIKGLTGVSEEKLKASYREWYEELLSYYEDLQSILEKVEEITEVTNKANCDARLTAALSAIAVVVAGTAIAFVQFVAAPLTLAPVIWKSGMLGITVMSSAACSLSLKNAVDLSRAVVRLKKLKKDLRNLQKRTIAHILTWVRPGFQQMMWASLFTFRLVT